MSFEFTAAGDYGYRPTGPFPSQALRHDVPLAQILAEDQSRGPVRILPSDEAGRPDLDQLPPLSDEVFPLDANGNPVHELEHTRGAPDLGRTAVAAATGSTSRASHSQRPQMAARMGRRKRQPKPHVYQPIDRHSKGWSPVDPSDPEWRLLVDNFNPWGDEDQGPGDPADPLRLTDGSVIGEQPTPDVSSPGAGGGRQPSRAAKRANTAWLNSSPRHKKRPKGTPAAPNAWML